MFTIFTVFSSTPETCSVDTVWTDLVAGRDPGERQAEEAGTDCPETQDLLDLWDLLVVLAIAVLW